MATWIAEPGRESAGYRPQTVARPVTSRRRRTLAGTLEVLLAPAVAPRFTQAFWPRIPYANRVAIAEPMHELVAMLRDPAIVIADDALPRILALATHPASPAFGPHPTQAQFTAYALLDELRTAADCASG
jgi:hypothetical protein